MIGLGNDLWGAAMRLPAVVELFPDGTFSLGISQMTAARGAALAWHNSNSLRVAMGATSEPWATIALPTSPGVSYTLRVDVTQDAAGGTLRAYRADGTTLIASALAQLTGARSLTFTAQDATSVIVLAAATSTAGQAAIFDNASLRRS